VLFGIENFIFYKIIPFLAFKKNLENLEKSAFLFLALMKAESLLK
jgi:hypothetical protein